MLFAGARMPGMRRPRVGRLKMLLALLGRRRGLKPGLSSGPGVIATRRPDVRSLAGVPIAHGRLNR